MFSYHLPKLLRGVDVCAEKDHNPGAGARRKLENATPGCARSTLEWLRATGSSCMLYPEEGGVPMTTGQKMQALRKGRGLTQEQLAARLGVSRQTVSRWELAETLPDTQNLLPLKEALGVSIDTLLDSAQGLEEPAPQAGPAPGAASFGARAVAVPAAVPAPAGGLFPGVGHPVLSAAHPPAPVKNSPGSSGGVLFMLPRWRAAPTPGFGTAGPRGRLSPAPPGGRAPCRRAPRPSW